MTKHDDAISKEALEVLGKSYARRLVPDETGGYVASIHEFPGCIAEGDTAEEAISNLDKAAESWIEAALFNHYKIREPVSFHGYSGKIALRIPRGLHKQIAELAELEETSINQLLVTAISQYLGNQNSYREMKECIVAELRNVMTFSPTINIISGMVAGALLNPPITYIESAPLLLAGQGAKELGSPVHFGQYNFEAKQFGTC